MFLCIGCRITTIDAILQKAPGMMTRTIVCVGLGWVHFAICSSWCVLSWDDIIVQTNVILLRSLSRPALRQ